MCQEPGPTRLQVAGGSGLLCPNRLDIDQASDVLSLNISNRDEYGQIEIILKLGLNFMRPVSSVLFWSSTKRVVWPNNSSTVIVKWKWKLWRCYHDNLLFVTIFSVLFIIKTEHDAVEINANYKEEIGDWLKLQNPNFWRHKILEIFLLKLRPHTF